MCIGFIYYLSPVSVSVVFIDVQFTSEETTIQDLNYEYSVDFNLK